ncbi:putative membrane protein [Clostridium saccharoperbutylacetonicum]|nr:hypothetical protein [Clostridium saccharoperbutylacetonicum]NRT62201.1 putative membrane protein [Clostridium saccharoperbutylacetonicum]NSB25532.1 putative membrane protein [Clostridium saccharoperbutylacetonicum]NSB44902.1 putative membrane protein [Clostridium saccharoperbutylacetonicum]
MNTNKIKNHKKSENLTYAAILLILAGFQYLITEAVAASAWKSPSYSYTYNFISDLVMHIKGELFLGRLINSPLHFVMNGGFITKCKVYYL